MPTRDGAGAVLRWARAAVLAAVTVGVSAVAHAAASGHLPGPLGLAGCAVVTTALLAALLGRPASTARIIGLLAAGQTALHVAFGALAGRHIAVPPPGGPSAATAAPGAGEHAAMGHAVPPAPTGGALSFAPLDPGVLDPGTTGTGPLGSLLDPRMALVHAVAAVALGLWLAAGERTVWRLVVLLAAPVADLIGRVRLALLLAGALGAATPSREPARPAVAPDTAPLRQVLLAVCAPRRGPPLAPAR